MTANDFFEHFATLADAPGGILKLRELILQSALQGKLVLQDPTDEPADRLLEKITQEHPDGTTTKNCTEDDLSEEEILFAIPKTWRWTRIGRVCHDWGQTIPAGEFTYIDVSAIDNDNGVITERAKRLAASNAPSRARKIVKQGTVIYCTVRPYLRNIAILTRKYEPSPIASTAFSVLHPYGGILPGFLFRYLRSVPFCDYVSRFAKGVAYPAVGDKAVNYAPFPLPPLAEQKRIVAKVDRLMALCDALEAQQQARHAVRSRLHATLLGNLQTAANADFARAWQRLRDHFAELFTPGEAALDAVAQLRQTILQLAVQGKLATQNEMDEPVSTFVSKIDAAKAELSNGRRPRQVEPALPLKEASKPFAIPASWIWKRFGEVTICRDGERVPIESGIREGRRGDFDYYGASGVIDKIDDYLFDKPLLLIGEDGANLVNRSTPIAFIATGKYWVNNHAHVLDSISLDALRYLEVFINAIDLKPYLTGTAQPKMNQAKMNSIAVAVPPLAEQQRIVAKVQQLMAQCDALEASLKAAATVSERWSAAAVRQLLDGSAHSVPAR